MDSKVMKVGKKVQHTAGPWRDQFAKDHITDSRGNRNEVYGVWGPGGDCVAVCKGIIAPNEANARLIAAAPELLEALGYAQEIIRTARRYFPKSIQNSDTFQLENTNAAISKAIGKAKGEL